MLQSSRRYHRRLRSFRLQRLKASIFGAHARNGQTRSFSVVTAEISGFGGPEVVSVREHSDIAEPKSDEILVEMQYSSLNHIDCWMRRGYGGKLFENWRDHPFPLVVGRDVVGRVVDVGSNVWRWQVGDKVIAATSPLWQHGSHTTVARVAASDACAAPKDLDARTSGTFPYVALTAHECCRAINPQGGEKVLVIGGSGSVGSFVAQFLRRHYKCGVITTSSAKNLERTKEVTGVSHVIDYEQAPFYEQISDCDAVIDCSAKAVDDADMLRVLKSGGTLATPSGDFIKLTDEYGSIEGAGRGGITLVKRKLRYLQSHGVHYKWVYFQPNAKMLSTVADSLRSGEYRLPIDRDFDFDKIRDAHAFVDSGEASGKVALRF